MPLRLLLALPLSLAIGCLAPQSAVVGQTAVSAAPGSSEAGISAGVGYRQLSPDEEGAEDVTELRVPAMEGNLLHGLSEALGFNLHLSPAGLQPGLKIGLSRGPGLNVALLPSAALLYSKTGGADDSDISQVGLMGGTKLLLSGPTGVYGAVGYDIQWYQVSSEAGIEGGGEDNLTTLQHNLSGAIGFELMSGSLRIRPEVAIIFSPIVTLTAEEGDGEEEADATGFAILPSVTFAVASP